MAPDQSLKENVVHGTPDHPVRAMHFTAGPGTGYPEHFFVQRHWHDYIEILLIRRGMYLMEINLENHRLEAGDICILNSGELHQITGFQPTDVHDAVLFDPQILAFSYSDEWESAYIRPFLNQTLMVRNILRQSDAAYAGIFPLVTQLITQALEKKSGWYIRCKLLLLELMGQLSLQALLLPAKETLSRTDMRRIRRYKAIISYIELHYREPLSLQQLSEIIHCNHQYLCRFFREIAGVSPIQYLISYRIERACFLLAHSEQPVTDIALDCGFENISYFIRKFRELKGCTPKDYRKLLT